MRIIGILLMAMSSALLITIIVIISSVLKSELFKIFSILKWHRRMIIWVLVLSIVVLTITVLNFFLSFPI